MSGIDQIPDDVKTTVDSIEEKVDVIDTNVDTVNTTTQDTNSDLVVVDGYAEKIDDAATDGLAGVSNSLAYRTHEVERHFHSRERWLGAAVTPSGETHVADNIGTSKTAFRLDAGNNDWGAWVQTLGSSDTPVIFGSVKFDPHRVVITAVERANAVYFIQFAQGESGAAALSTGAYSDTVIQLTNTAPRGQPFVIQSRRIIAGTKAWARCLCVGQNTGTIDFYFGIHEYEG